MVRFWKFSLSKAIFKIKAYNCDFVSDSIRIHEYKEALKSAKYLFTITENIFFVNTYFLWLFRSIWDIVAYRMKL